MSEGGEEARRLAAWLNEGVLPGRTTQVELEKFSGGQSNPTFRLRTDSGDYVLIPVLRGRDSRGLAGVGSG